MEGRGESGLFALAILPQETKRINKNQAWWEELLFVLVFHPWLQRGDTRPGGHERAHPWPEPPYLFTALSPGHDCQLDFTGEYVGSSCEDILSGYIF